MANSKEISKRVNSKSTKDELKTALNEAISALKEHEQFKPREIEKQKAESEILSDVDKLMNKGNLENASIEDGIGILERLINEFKEQYSKNQNSFTVQSDDVTKIQEAIDIKKAQLKQLYGVEEHLMSLSGAIEAYKTKTVELNALYKRMSDEKETEFEAKKLQLNAEIDDLQKRYDNLHKQLKVTYDRERDEEKYNFEREKTIETDKWEDEKRKKKSDFDKYLSMEEEKLSYRKKELDKRDEEITEKEKGIETLNKAIVALEAKIEESVNEAKTKATEKAKRSFTYEKTILESKYKGDINLLQSKVETLETKHEEDKEEIKDLKTKLQIAYDRIKEVSESSMQASSNTNYTRNLESLAQNLSKQKDSNSNK